MNQPIAPQLLSNQELLALDCQALEAILAHISARLLERGQMLATAESCTGGMIAAACTDLAGSSQWFERGLVTYSNAAKTELLGVPASLIALHGAVSEPVARAMAEGAIAHSHAQVSVAVTGVPAALIAQHGAVSEPVARAMAEGAIARSHAQVSVAVTGVAGPTGGSADKPVGTVWLAWHVNGHTHSERCQFAGDRAAVRAATVRRALGQLQALLRD